MSGTIELSNQDIQDLVYCIEAQYFFNPSIQREERLLKLKGRLLKVEESA